MSLGSNSIKTKSRGRIESEFLLAAPTPPPFLVKGDDRIIAGACPLSPLPASRAASVSRSLNEALKDANCRLTAPADHHNRLDNSAPCNDRLYYATANDRLASHAVNSKPPAEIRLDDDDDGSPKPLGLSHILEVVRSNGLVGGASSVHDLVLNRHYDPRNDPRRSAPPTLLHHHRQQLQQQQRFDHGTQSIASTDKTPPALVTTDVNDNDVDALENDDDDEDDDDDAATGKGSDGSKGGGSGVASQLGNHDDGLSPQHSRNPRQNDSQNSGRRRHRLEPLSSDLDDPLRGAVETVVIDLSSDGDGGESLGVLGRQRRCRRRRSGVGDRSNSTPTTRRSSRLGRRVHNTSSDDSVDVPKSVDPAVVLDAAESRDSGVVDAAAAAAKSRRNREKKIVEETESEEKEEIEKRNHHRYRRRGGRKKKEEEEDHRRKSPTGREEVIEESEEGEERRRSTGSSDGKGEDVEGVGGGAGAAAGAAAGGGFVQGGSSEVVTSTLGSDRGEETTSVAVLAHGAIGTSAATKSRKKRPTREERKRGKEKKSKHKRRNKDKRREGEEEEEGESYSPRDCALKASKKRRDSRQRNLATSPPSGDDEVVVLDVDTEKDDPTDSTKAPTDSATHPDGGSIVFLGMDGPSDNLRSSTAVNMHQRKWKRSVDYIGNWMVAKCPHDMMVRHDDGPPEAISDDVILLSPDVLLPAPTSEAPAPCHGAAAAAAGSSRKRHRQDRSHDNADGAGVQGGVGAAGVVSGAGTTTSGGSAFLESFYNDQHLKRMKLNDESVMALRHHHHHHHHPPSSSSTSSSSSTVANSRHHHHHHDPSPGPSSSSSPFPSSSSSVSSPEECIAASSATHVILADLDAWGRTLLELASARPLPSRAFLYGFSSSSSSSAGGSGGGSFDSLLSSSSQASDYFRQLVARGQSLFHRQPEFGVEMTLRYQAGRLDVLLDVGTSFTILPGLGASGGGGGVEEIRKQFAFNAMRNRRNVTLFDPNNFSHFDLAQRITANANGNVAALGDGVASARQTQHQPQQQQPIVIDP